MEKILGNLKFTRKGINFEHKTIPLGYLVPMFLDV
jgi:hypothetical protein